jgi:hypothetical protein
MQKLVICCKGRVTKRLEKIAKNLEKVAKTVAQPKISMSTLSLKVQSIYIKPILKPKNTCKNTLNLWKNVKIFAQARSSQKCHYFFGLLHLLKSHNWQQRKAQLAIYQPICGLYYKRFRIVIYDCKGMLQFAAYLMIISYAPS